MSIFLGDPKISVGYYIWKSMIPALLGNIVGGGLMVGVMYWYLVCVVDENLLDERKQLLTVFRTSQVKALSLSMALASLVMRRRKFGVVMPDLIRTHRHVRRLRTKRARQRTWCRSSRCLGAVPAR